MKGTSHVNKHLTTRVARKVRRTFNARRQLVRLSKNLSRGGLYEFLEEEYAQIPAGACVLSVGSGGQVNRLLRRYAEARGFEVTSFDIDPDRGPDLVGDVCTYDLGEARYDAIVISEVLEHLHSPHLAVQNLFRALADGGRLILTVPFMLPIHEEPHDYFRYTRYGLAFLLRDFSDVEIRERNSYFEAVDVLYVRFRDNRHRYTRLTADLLTLYAYVRLPFTRLLGKLVQSTIMTTGYTVSATKRAA